MKVLVTGATGLLGSEIVRVFKRDHEVIATSRRGDEARGVASLDILDEKAGLDLIQQTRPDVVINAAAYTAVDRAETESAAAFALNADAPARLDRACKTVGAHFIHISTDYVFSGDKSGPYVETDATGPRSVYGASKLEGEKQILSSGGEWTIARVAWLYGPAGPNFAATMLKLGRDRNELKVVIDQRGTPTYTVDVAEQLLVLADHRYRGIIHVTNQGETTWHGFTTAIFEGLGRKDMVVHPCRTEEFPRPAPRPANSVLENTRLTTLGCDIMRPWQDALDDYLAWYRAAEGDDR